MLPSIESAMGAFYTIRVEVTMLPKPASFFLVFGYH